MNHYNLQTESINNYINSFPELSSKVQIITTTSEQEDILDFFQIPLLYNSHFSTHYIHEFYLKFLLNLDLNHQHDDSHFHIFTTYLEREIPLISLKFKAYEENSELFLEHLKKFQTIFKNKSSKEIFDAIHITSISKNFPQFEANNDYYSNPLQFSINHFSHHHAFVALKKGVLFITSSEDIPYLASNSSSEILSPFFIKQKLSLSVVNPQQIINEFLNSSNIDDNTHKSVQYPNNFKLNILNKFIFLLQSKESIDEFFNSFDTLISNKDITSFEKKDIFKQFFYLICRYQPNHLSSNNELNYSDNYSYDLLSKFSNHPFVKENLFFEEELFLNTFVFSNNHQQDKQSVNLKHNLVQFLQYHSNSDNFSNTSLYRLDNFEKLLHPFNIFKIKFLISHFEDIDPSVSFSELSINNKQIVKDFLPIIFPLLSDNHKNNLIPLFNQLLQSNKHRTFPNLKDDKYKYPYLHNISPIDFLSFKTTEPFQFLHENLYLFNKKPSLNNPSYINLLQQIVDSLLSEKSNSINSESFNNINIPKYLFEHLNTCAKTPFLQQLVFKNNINDSYLFEEQNLPLLHNKIHLQHPNIDRVLQETITNSFQADPSIFQQDNLIQEILNISSQDVLPSYCLKNFGIKISDLFNDNNLSYLPSFTNLEPSLLQNIDIISLLLKNNSPILTQQVKESILTPQIISNLTYDSDFKIYPLKHFKDINPQHIFNTFNQEQVFLWEQILKEPEWITLFPDSVKKDSVFWAKTLINIISYFGKDSSAEITSDFMKIIPIDITKSPNFIKDFFSNITYEKTVEHCLKNIPSHWIINFSDFISLLDIIEPHLSNKSFGSQYQELQQVFDNLDPQFSNILTSLIDVINYNDSLDSSINLIDYFSSEINKIYLQNFVNNTKPSSSKRIKF